MSVFMIATARERDGRNHIAILEVCVTPIHISLDKGSHMAVPNIKVHWEVESDSMPRRE